jgi:hypothetical protein
MKFALAIVILAIATSSFGAQVAVTYDSATRQTFPTNAELRGNTLTLMGGITFPNNVRQTFKPGATTPGLNLGSFAGDPSAPSNGDMWYNTLENAAKIRINGVNVVIGSGVAPSGTIINPSPGTQTAGLPFVTVDATGTNAVGTNALSIDSIASSSIYLSNSVPGSLLGLRADSVLTNVILGSGMVIKTNTMTLVSEVALNVKDFGAIPGDGQDDYAAITNAIASADAMNRPVLFEGGSYEISKPLVISPTQSPLRLIGTGGNTAINYTGGSLSNMVLIRTDGYYVFNTVIKDLLFRGNQNVTNLMLIDKGSHLYMENVRFTECAGGRALTLRSNVSGILNNVSVSANQFGGGFTNKPGTGIELITCNNIQMFNPLPEGVSGWGIILRDTSVQNTIFGGASEGNKGGILLTNSGHNTILNHDCEANQEDFDVRFVGSHHNKIIGGVYSGGIWLAECSGNQISTSVQKIVFTNSFSCVFGPGSLGVTGPGTINLNAGTSANNEMISAMNGYTGNMLTNILNEIHVPHVKAKTMLVTTNFSGDTSYQLLIDGPPTGAIGTGHIGFGLINDRSYWSLRFESDADLTFDTYNGTWNRFARFDRAALGAQFFGAVTAPTVVITNLTASRLLGAHADRVVTNVTLGAGLSLDTNTMTLSASGGGGGGVAAFHFSPVSWGASTAETTVFTNNFSAGQLGTNGSALYFLSGLFTNNNSGVNVSLRVRVYLGSTTMYDATTANNNEQSSPRPFNIGIRLRALDSVTSQEVLGTYVMNTHSTVGVTTGRGSLNVSSPTQGLVPFMGTATENSANDLGFGVTLTLSTNHANVGIKMSGADGFLIP